MKQRGLLENSVIVITGDHGQEFNDNRRNYWGHSSNFTRYQTGVPLLLVLPHAGAGLASASNHAFRRRADADARVPRLHKPFSSYSVGRSLFEPGGRETLVLSEYADFAIVLRTASLSCASRACRCSIRSMQSRRRSACPSDSKRRWSKRAASTGARGTTPGDRRRLE